MRTSHNFTKELSKLPCPVSGKQRDWSRVIRISEQGDQLSSQGKACEEGDQYGRWGGWGLAFIVTEVNVPASFTVPLFSIFIVYCHAVKVTHAHGKEKIGNYQSIKKKKSRQNPSSFCKQRLSPLIASWFLPVFLDIFISLEAFITTFFRIPLFLVNIYIIIISSSYQRASVNVIFNNVTSQVTMHASYLFLWLHQVLVGARGIFISSPGSCGARAYLPCGIWDLSSLTRDRIPALQGGLSTTGSPGKSHTVHA